MYSTPKALDEVNRRVVYLETEKAALSAEKDDKSKKLLQHTEKQLEELKKKQATLNKE